MDGLLGHVIDLNFTSHNAMTEACLLWHLEEYQLENGPFTGFIHAIHTSHIQLAYSFHSHGVFQKGKTPKNAYLLASPESEGPLTHNGLRLDTDELLVLTDEDEIDYTASTAVGVITWVVEKDFFEAAFQSYFNKAFEYDKIDKRIQLKENEGVGFRAKARETLTNLMTQSEKLKDDPAFHDKTEQEILQLLFRSFDFSRERKKVLQSDIDANHVREYIEDHYKEHIHMKKLISSKGFSERTIRLGFNELFGFSPKQYLISYRLGKVEHSLLKNEPSTQLTVENIAYDHGFSHMGRFSSKYKQMFGESPSFSLNEATS